MKIDEPDTPYVRATTPRTTPTSFKASLRYLHQKSSSPVRSTSLGRDHLGDLWRN